MFRALVTFALLAAFAGAALAQDSSPSPAASPEASPAASPAADPHEGHGHGPGEGHGHGHGELTVDPKTVNLASPAAPEELGAPNPKLTDQKTKASYALGFKFGSDLNNALKRMDISMDTETMLDGVKDAIGAGKPALPMKEMEKSVEGYITEQRKLVADKNKKEGEDFLATNKKRDGVKATPSGLQYEVVKEGTGPKPGDKDTVSVHYRGTLINGTEFDSSFKRNEPTTFPVSGVIPGWSEALKLMPVGAKWKLYIPSDLAYGPQGAHPRIGPNQVLVFEVELLEIKGLGGVPASPSPDASPAPAENK